MQLPYKGLSRCFVFKKEHIKIVYDTIKEINRFEMSYMPKQWVTLYEGKIQLIYNGKFDISIPILVQKCAEKGVGIVIDTKDLSAENYDYL